MSNPHTYTAQYLGKWHAGFTVGNQSFVLHAHEGTEDEAKWYAEMLDKAFAKLRVAEEVELDESGHCLHCGYDVTDRSEPRSPEVPPYCHGCGNKIKR